VMKPGGAFEMIEEDLYWPGKSCCADADSETELVSSPESISGSKTSPPLVGTPTEATAGSGTARSESPSTPRPIVRQDKEPTAAESTRTVTATSEPKKAEPVPKNSPPRRPPSPKLLFQPPPMAKSFTTPSPHTRPPALSISTMASAPSKAAVTEVVADGKMNTDTSRSSISTPSDSVSTPSHTNTSSHRRTSFTPSSPSTSISMSSPQIPQFSPVKPSFSHPHLVRTAPKAPANPRDHTVLETIYNEMHASRFINLAPLSLLPSNLSTWFKGGRFLKCFLAGI
jgi:hypothetical protein